MKKSKYKKYKAWWDYAWEMYYEQKPPIMIKEFEKRYKHKQES